MGFFAILKEAHKLTNKKFFSEISLTIPFAMFYIQIFTIIDTKISPQIDYGLTRSIYLILVLVLIILSTYNVIYTIARFYNSKDITYMKVIGVLSSENYWQAQFSVFSTEKPTKRKLSARTHFLRKNVSHAHISQN